MLHEARLRLRSSRSSACLGDSVVTPTGFGVDGDPWYKLRLPMSEPSNRQRCILSAWTSTRDEQLLHSIVGVANL